MDNGNGFCGQAWSLTGSTGTMAAALAANSLVFAMGAVADAALTVNPNVLRRGPVEIEGLQMIFTAIVASATPIASGRALQLFRGSNNAQAMPTGGTALTPLPKRTKDQGLDTGLIGDVARIGATAGLTVGAFTRGTVPLATFDLVGGGAAGNRLVYETWELLNGAALYLDPGEILVVSNPAAFDALLTWQLTVNIDYRRRDNQ
jgi:hypothetical protein